MMNRLSINRRDRLSSLWSKIVSRVVVSTLDDIVIPPLPSSPIQPPPPYLFRRLATLQTAGASPSTSIAVAVSSGFTPFAGVVAFAAARSNKDFATADRIRDELAARGIVIEDSADGVRWRRTG